MSQGDLGAGGAGRISINELAALNDEITALVHAGVPLERGLLRAGSDLPGGLSRITAALGARLSQGQSLPEALEAEKQAIPPLYRAVVEAGARAGRLSVALEGLSRYVRGYSEARSSIGLALWYPLLVLTLAYALFLGLVTLVIPRFVAAFETLDLSLAAPLRWLEQVGEWAPYWWPVWPILLGMIAVGWVRSGIAANFQSTSWSMLKVFPWMRTLLSDYEAANFSELLALLLEHQVAYPAALMLAAEATGDPTMIGEARQLAGAVERGEAPGDAINRLGPHAFRPMLRWVLATGQQQGSLVEALRNMAVVYRKRAAFQAEKLQLFLPVVLMVLIGASATLLYALTLFLPLVTMLRELSLK